MTTNRIARRLADLLWTRDGRPEGLTHSAQVGLLFYEVLAVDVVKALSDLGYSVLTAEQLAELQARRPNNRGPRPSEAKRTGETNAPPQ
jgi:hypothetical protein